MKNVLSCNYQEMEIKTTVSARQLSRYTGMHVAYLTGCVPFQNSVVERENELLKVAF